MERGCIGEGRHGGMDWEESGMEGWMERKEEWIDWKGIKEGWIGEERGMAMTMAMYWWCRNWCRKMAQGIPST